MKFIFFGTNIFSRTVFDSLSAHGYAPEAIITVPDDVAGRKQVLTPPHIKEKCAGSGIHIAQYSSLKDPETRKKIASFGADFAIVAAYRKIIPQAVLDMFPNGVLNVHPSLLPKWRGPSPIESAISAGDTETGVSIILLDADMDHGPIILQEKTDIGSDEYFEDVYGRLARMGGAMLLKLIPQWLDGKIEPKEQDHTRATFSKMLSWKDGKVDPGQSVSEIYNRIRAFACEPGCWMEPEQKSESGKDKAERFILKRFRAKPAIGDGIGVSSNGKGPGLCEIGKQLYLICKDGALVLEQVQPQGKRVMSGIEFLNGYRKKIQVRLFE